MVAQSKNSLFYKTNSGYQLASGFKVFYNGEEVTSTEY